MIGIECMNDDPAEVDVLYGKVHVEGQSNSLQDLADSLVQFFVEKGEIIFIVILLPSIFENRK